MRQRKVKKRTGSFYAVNEFGQLFNLDVIATMVDATTLSDDSQVWVETIKEIRTSDGNAVNRIEQGKYQVVISGQILTSTDPGAP